MFFVIAPLEEFLRFNKISVFFNLATQHLPYGFLLIAKALVTEFLTIYKTRHISPETFIRTIPKLSPNLPPNFYEKHSNIIQ